MNFKRCGVRHFKMRDWQENVYVKIPITNTKAESALPLIAELAEEGVKLNVTAILTTEQVKGVAGALNQRVCCCRLGFCRADSCDAVWQRYSVT